MRLTSACLLLALGCGVTAQQAAAAPNADLARIQAQVRDLEMQAGAAHEEASRAKADLQKVNAKLTSIRARLSKQSGEMSSAQASVDAIARQLYAQGGLSSTLQVLLSDDPAAFLSQAALLSQLNSTQAAQIRRAQTSRLRLSQTRAAVSQQQASARALQVQMSLAESRVNARLDQAQSVRAGLQQDQRRRLSMLQAQRRQQQQAESRQAAQRAQSVSVGASAQISSRVRKAVQYALAQVGEPYSYTARPPSSWDCSKLTAAAWANAGVGLTALSYTQWDQTKRVPVSSIRPGDLVFYFGRGAHHVAMYVGNGKMVSASNPSDGVELTDFLGPWYRERFSGVGRILN